LRRAVFAGDNGSSMQIAGEPCRICAGTIELEVGARGCLDCEQAFHEPCLPDVRRCPSCDRPFEETNAKHGIFKPPPDRAPIERGRRWMLGIAGAVLSIELATIALFTKDVQIASIIRISLTALLLYCLYAGFKWARIVTAALMGLGSIFVLLATLTIFDQPSIAAKVLLFAIAAVYVAVPCLLIGSSDLHAFLDDQHAKRERG
jgi:hypothetical protein